MIEEFGDTGPALFQRVTRKLKVRVGAEVYSSWFGRIKLDEASKSVVRLSVPTTFLRSWINSHYLPDITELWREENPDLLKLEIVVRTASRARPVDDHDKVESLTVVDVPKLTPAKFMRHNDSTQAPVAIQNAGSPAKSVIGSPLDARYSFDAFVEGASNRVALAAAKSVA